MSLGRPAAGIPLPLEIQGFAGIWKQAGNGRTDADGRSGDLYPSHLRLQTAVYRLTFDLSGYFRSQKVTSFYPEVVVTFSLRDAAQPYHVPLLVSPFGYGTYRDSCRAKAIDSSCYSRAPADRRISAMA
jgi:5-hydroxyisourate hydrolase